jgi:hypothetical protein
MVTLIIHGTFARDEIWWRLKPARASFASRLEAALAARGLVGTVWQPALDAGLQYADFSWSHNNYHPDRRRGGRSLARALARLADALGGTREAPLEVNLIAHSHGGNVVLDALRHLDPRVRARRVVLLGTPLIAARPGLRILRLAIAIGLFGFVSILLLATPLFFIDPPADGPSGPTLLALLLPMIAFYGWILVFVAWLVDKLLLFVTWPISWLRGRGAGQVYGPSPGAVSRLVARGKVGMFTTHDDEADLALQLSAAPRRLYVEFVRAKLHPLIRVLELIVFRPIVLGMVLGVVEAVLERYVLGFPWRRVLFIDYEMANLKRGRAYPPWLLERVDVSDELLPTIRRSSAALAVTVPPPIETPTQVRKAGRRVSNLYEKLAIVAENFKAQLRLRHSVYYEAEAVIERVADIVAGSQPSQPSQPSPAQAPTRKP